MKRIFTRISNYVFLFTALALTAVSNPIFAQERTFYESFDATPQGEVPDGWITYTLGGAFGVNWERTTYGFFGPNLMSSGIEYALPGEIDEDWLVTPQITPAANDYLIFDAGQEFTWDDLGSTFEIRIST